MFCYEYEGNNFLLSFGTYDSTLEKTAPFAGVGHCNFKQRISRTGTSRVLKLVTCWNIHFSDGEILGFGNKHLGSN